MLIIFCILNINCMHHFRDLNESDPLKRIAEKGDFDEEFSPMNPPDPFNPPSLESTRYDDMHPFLKLLMDEHQMAIVELDFFETTLQDIRDKGLSRDADRNIRNFFEFFDNKFIPHNRKEEGQLFSLLQERLYKSGEHGKGQNPVTGVNVLRDDHLKILQLAVVVFHFFALICRLPDQHSRLLVLDLALEQAKSLVEIMRLHIFQEDHVVFPQAQRLLLREELDQMHAAK